MYSYVLKKPQNAVSRDQGVIFMEEWKTRMLRETQTVEGWITKFQRGMRTLLGTGLEAIQVTFCQRIWMHCAHVQRA